MPRAVPKLGSPLHVLGPPCAHQDAAVREAHLVRDDDGEPIFPPATWRYHKPRGVGQCVLCKRECDRKRFRARGEIILDDNLAARYTPITMNDVKLNSFSPCSCPRPIYPGTYSVIRYFGSHADGFISERRIASGLSLEEARARCSGPSQGRWVDDYVEEVDVVAKYLGPEE